MRVLSAVAIAIVVLLLAAGVSAFWLVRSPLPAVDGDVTVAGISDEVTIRRDARGIPHIDAANAPDVFFGEGYACAQDRLWQMDIYRREAEGTLSELFGPATLSVDKYFRTLGFAELAQSSVRNAGPEENRILDAFAAGVNAAVAQHALPLEFRLLGYRPAPWTAADSIAVGLLITRGQDDNWPDIELRSDLAAKVGARAAYELTDNQIPSMEEFVPGYAPVRSKAAVSAAAQSALANVFAAANGVDPPLGTERQGSNNWAVAASRTNTGKPVFSNDTHLDHSLPSTWWVAQLHGGGYDVEGFTLPGVPGVIIGHNQSIAFGVTSAAEDVEDLFVERFSTASSDEYLADGHWVQAAHRPERIVLKGAGFVWLDVLSTRHGPIVKRAGKTGLALAWTVLRDGENLSAVAGIDRAQNWTEFRAALSQFIAPTLNFAYADVAGHIGYQDAGRVPMRRSGDGTLPVEGNDDRFAWLGDVPFDRLPHALDPPIGFLASANNELVPSSFTPRLSRDFLSPYRIHEIHARLAQGGRRSPQEIGAIQADSFDYPRSRLAAIAQPILARSSAAADQDIAQVLLAWNGQATIDATAPTFLAALDTALQARLLQPKLGVDLVTRYADHHHVLTPVIRALDRDTSLSSIGITRATVLAAVLAAAHDAEARLGYPAKPLARWGDANAAQYAHPLGIRWPLSLLNAPTIDQPGDAYTVFQSRPSFGPSMRFVGDLSDWDDSSMLLTLGESGIWTDAHYDDQETDWVNVAWRPTPFSDDAVQRAAVDTLRLEPEQP